MQLCHLLMDAFLCRLHNVPLVSLRLSQACRDPALWPDLRACVTKVRTEVGWRSFLLWLVPRAVGLQTLAFKDTEVCARPATEVPAIGGRDACV